MVNGLPEKVTNFNVYDSGNEDERLIGVGAELTLPTMEAMTETISGAGIAGEFDSVTPGHFGAIDQEVPFRVLDPQLVRIASGDYANLTIRAAIQYNDVATGKLVQRGIRVNVRGIVKTLSLGKVGVGKPGEPGLTLGLLYIKVTDEKNFVYLEYDKLNFVYIVGGVDKMAAIRDLI